jgi:hypothetical protein
MAANGRRKSVVHLGSSTLSDMRTVSERPVEEYRKDGPQFIQRLLAGHKQKKKVI